MSGKTTEPPHAFPPTRWSLVGRAGNGSEVSRLSALDGLLGIYCPALRGHLIRNCRVPPSKADDLVQGFVADKVLKRNLLAEADRARGKFRSFLLKAFSNYVASQMRRDQALKRGGQAEMVNVADNPDVLVSQPVAGGGFDSVWAKQILVAAINNMQSACESKNRADIWRMFESRVLQPSLNGDDPVPYEDLVSQLNLVSPAQASNLLITAKRMFKRALWDVVRDTVERDAEVDEEISDLRNILAENQ
jgi:DNA-directed RNA polymerase specialized sigma24 family protein